MLVVRTATVQMLKLCYLDLLWSCRATCNEVTRFNRDPTEIRLADVLVVAFTNVRTFASSLRKMLFP